MYKSIQFMEIKTLQNAPRDTDELEALLKAKEERKNQEAMCTLQTHKV